MKDSHTARFVAWQVNNESDTYSAKSLAIKQPVTIKDAVKMTEEFKKNCDVLYFVALQGITDNNGKPMLEKDIEHVIIKTLGKPTIAASYLGDKYGALCSVIFRKDEHGENAAKMLLKAMQGTPFSKLPITKNRQGKAIINVTTITISIRVPDPMVLHSAELIKTVM